VARLRAGLAAAAALLAAGCSWHRAGDADAVAADTAGLSAPAPGMTLAEVLALADAREQGDFRISVERVRLSKVAGGLWEPVPERRARSADFAPEPGADYVVVLRRDCRDWEGRERWSDERASWFLLHGGRLAGFDHWSFGPRCAVANAYAPVAADSPARGTERDLLRWLEQRYPPGHLPVEVRFGRGRALAAAGRLDEARAMLRFGDDALDAREHLHRPREATAEESEAFEAEGRRLRGLRANLSEAIRQAEEARRQ
jgi:hypothetical protein